MDVSTIVEQVRENIVTESTTSFSAAAESASGREPEFLLNRRSENQ